MTYNLANVVLSVSVSPADQTPSGLVAGEGNIIAIPDGTQWPDPNNDAIVPMVVHGTIGDTLNGASDNECIIQLCASDNFSAGVLNWDFIINIRGLPTVRAMNIPVNYASGATQNVWEILQAAGWTP